MKRSHSQFLHSTDVDDALALPPQFWCDVWHLVLLSHYREQWLNFCALAREYLVIFPWEEGSLSLPLYNRIRLDNPVRVVYAVQRLHWNVTTGSLAGATVRWYPQSLNALNDIPSLENALLFRPCSLMCVGELPPQYDPRVEVFRMCAADISNLCGWFHVAPKTLLRLRGGAAPDLPSDVWHLIWRRVLMLRRQEKWQKFVELSRRCGILLPPHDPSRPIELPIYNCFDPQKNMLITTDIHSMVWCERNGRVRVRAITISGFEFVLSEPSVLHWFSHSALRHASGTCWEDEEIMTLQHVDSRTTGYRPKCTQGYYDDKPIVGTLALPDLLSRATAYRDKHVIDT